MFGDLKDNPKEWKLLREVLNKNKSEMEQHIVNGSAPLFGYPTVLYEIPHSEAP